MLEEVGMYIHTYIHTCTYCMRGAHCNYVSDISAGVRPGVIGSPWTRADSTSWRRSALRGAASGPGGYEGKKYNMTCMYKWVKVGRGIHTEHPLALRFIKNDGPMNEVSSSIQHRLESHFPVIAGFISQFASLLTKPHLQALDILGFTCVSTSTVCLRLYTLPKCLTSCVALAQYSQPPLIFLWYLVDTCPASLRPRNSRSWILQFSIAVLWK